MVSIMRLPKGRRRPSGKKDKARRPRGPKILEQFVRGLRQKPGGTKPKPKAVPKGTKTGPAVKGEMSTRPKKPDYRPKGVRPKGRVLADVKGIRDPKFADRPLRTKSLGKGMQGLLEQRPIRKAKPGSRPRPKITKPSSGPTPKTVPPGMSLSGPRPKPKRPTRKPPTRRPSRRPTGGMGAIRRGMKGRRRGFQR